MNAVFEPFVKGFSSLCRDYGFQVDLDTYQPDGFGSGLLRLASQRYFLEFRIDGMGPEVTVFTGRSGQSAVDLAWIFAYLTRGLGSAKAGAASGWLYYFPHFTLNRWGEASIAWQADRLVDILQPMWPAVFIFLDMDGPRSADFAAFCEKADRAAAERATDGYRGLPEKIAERAPLRFAPLAEKSFVFLSAYGLKTVSASPVMVRYERRAEGAPGMYINVFHRLLSYQVGVHSGLMQSNPEFELNFDLEEMAAWHGAAYQPVSAQRPEELASALNRVARLYRSYAAPALAGDARLFEALHNRRIDAARRASRAWSERDRGK